MSEEINYQSETVVQHAGQRPDLATNVRMAKI